ncbi:hypothetical protein FRC18_006113 [Serendipita sp. 400]|nr:hypothetical protein FRC18_006113 [Serendipita sp. 400]
MHLKKMPKGSPSLPESSNNPAVEETRHSDHDMQEPAKTIEGALDLLSSLRKDIMSLITGGSATSGATLKVPLEVMGVLQSEKNQTAHVLWIGPKKSKEKSILDQVANLVNNSFRENGFITEKRPLKLHCTILNTSHRKGGGRRRIAFSKNDIFESDAYKNIALPSSSMPLVLAEEGQEQALQKTLTDFHVDFGRWNVDEIQLCTMGSRDAITGAYVSVGSIKLTEN